MLADHYRDLNRVMAATAEELVESPDVGGIVAESIAGYFADPFAQASIQKMLAGCPSESAGSTEAGQHRFLLQRQNGGSDRHPPSADPRRGDERSARRQSHRRVSKKTDLLIAGEKPAQAGESPALGIDILEDEEEFVRLLDES